MKSRILRVLFIAVPVFCISVFMYMTYFNAAYDHPGRYVYLNNCASCHGDDGEGTQALVPPLANADMALQHYDSLPCWIQNGLNRPITVNGKPYDQPMYPITITAIEMANLLNYLAADMIHVNRNYKSDSVAAMMRRCAQKGV